MSNLTCTTFLTCLIGQTTLTCMDNMPSCWHNMPTCMHTQYVIMHDNMLTCHMHNMPTCRHDLSHIICTYQLPLKVHSSKCFKSMKTICGEYGPIRPKELYPTTLLKLRKAQKSSQAPSLSGECRYVTTQANNDFLFTYICVLQLVLLVSTWNNILVTICYGNNFFCSLSMFNLLYRL